MMLDKNILAIVRNEDSPYKGLFSYGETHFQDLSRQELEKIFPELYRWTKVAFEESKSNALNMLFNLLWMDERVNVLNWEYSGLEHYRSRLALRFQWEKEAGPITMLSFLNGERIILAMLRKSLDGGILLFFEHPNTRDDSVLGQMDLNTAAISGSDRKELLEILTERIADKVEFIDHLLSDKHERVNFFTVAEPIEKVSCGDLEEENSLTVTQKATEPIAEPIQEENSDELDWEAPSVETKNAIEPMSEPVHELSAYDLEKEDLSTGTKVDTIPIIEPEATTQNKLDTKQDFEASQPPDNKMITEEGQTDQSKYKEVENWIDEMNKAIKGEELLKVFLYLGKNVKIDAREGAGLSIIKYSAIYFVLQNELDSKKSQKAANEKFELDGVIRKNKLIAALKIVLKTGYDQVHNDHWINVKGHLPIALEEVAKNKDNNEWFNDLIESVYNDLFCDRYKIDKG